MKQEFNYYGRFKPIGNGHRIIKTIKISAFLFIFLMVNSFSFPANSEIEGRLGTI